MCTTLKWLVCKEPLQNEAALECLKCNKFNTVVIIMVLIF